MPEYSIAPWAEHIPIHGERTDDRGETPDGVGVFLLPGGPDRTEVLVSADMGRNGHHCSACISLSPAAAAHAAGRLRRLVVGDLTPDLISGFRLRLVATMQYGLPGYWLFFEHVSWLGISCCIFLVPKDVRTLGTLLRRAARDGGAQVSDESEVGA